MNRLVAFPLLLLLAALPARGADIDLFLNRGGTVQGSANALFLLDNSANWEATLYKVDKTSVTKRHVIHEALHRVLTDSRYQDTLRAGLMAFAHGNSPKGGKVIAALDDLDGAHRERLTNLLYPGGVRTFGQEQLPGTNNAPDALLLHEAYLYLSGLTPRSGLQDGDHDANALDGGRYLAPARQFGDGCAANAVILIANGEPDSGENKDAGEVLQALGGRRADDPISVNPDQFESSWADEMARFMAGQDLAQDRDGNQNIVTYVIDVFDPAQVKNRPQESARALLRSIARQGRGRYFTASNVEELVGAIEKILAELQAVNSVFAAVNLPVSVNVRGTHLNQVYMGMFRPDAQNRPRWFGNLKLYRLGADAGTGSLALVDANGAPARSAATGFIVSNAVSHWSEPSTFWHFDPRGNPPSASDLPDGEVVEKGGAAQRLREAWPQRRLYTCSGDCTSGSELAVSPLSTANSAITAAQLGVADSGERNRLLDWLAGADRQDENQDGWQADVRPSVHGDVLHSRPAVINYNRTGQDDDVVVFYGANDGVFHAVQGGLGEDGGQELWGFVPTHFLPHLKTLRDNDTLGHPYFFDGSVAVLADDHNDDGRLVAADGDRVHLFLTLRRGGRRLYALDVSDPDRPRFLWQRSYLDTGFGELGQSWSVPRVALVDLGGTPTEVLIFALGYDPQADDAQPAGQATMGRGIMVVEAATGRPLWQAGPAPVGADHNLTVPEMRYSIPGDVKVLDRDADSRRLADRAYVGDTGGNLWRLDFQDPDPTRWTVTRLAELGGDDPPRKFLFAPEVVYDRDEAGPFDAVFIGSGDREHPFATATADRFYMIRDRRIDPDDPPAVLVTEGDLYDATANLIQVGDEDQRAAAKSDLAAAGGWYVALRPGEKVVGGVVVVAGSTFFSTHQPSTPSPAQCNSLGVARNYVLNFRDASATTDWDGVDGLTTRDRTVEMPGGGFPPSPVSVITQVDGRIRGAVVIGTWVADGPAPSDSRRRVYRFREVE